MKTRHRLAALVLIAIHSIFAAAAFGMTEAVTPLTDPGQAFNYVDPALSPCGNFAAFSRAPASGSYADSAMVARRATGGGWEATVLPSEAGKAIVSPGIAAGGKHAVFGVMAVSASGWELTPENILLVANPIDGAAAVDLRAAFTAAFTAPDKLYDPSFSACGGFLVFAAEIPTESWESIYGIYRMDLATGEIVEVYSTQGIRLNGPTASAGGVIIAFAYWDPSEGGSRMSVADMSIQRISPVSGALVPGFIQPVISADGRWVAYNDDATATIAIVQPGGDGGQVVASFTHQGDKGQRAAISGDGRYIAYYETDAYGHLKAYVHDRLNPGGRRLVNRKDTGEPATGAGTAYDSNHLGLSSDGTLCAFAMASSDIVPGASENTLGIYLSDGTGLAAPGPSLGSPPGAFLAGSDSDEESPVRIGLPVHSVNVSTLSLVMKGTLFYMPGWGYPVHITLTYNSADSWEGKYGPRWSLNYESLCRIGPSSVQVRKGTGEVLVFSMPGGKSLLEPLGQDFSLTPPAGITESLTVSDTLITRTRLKDLIRFEYTRGSAAGETAWLTAIVDRNDNRVTIHRNADDPARITSVSDPYGRQLLFYYGGPQGQCTRIEGPGGGRNIELAYGTTSGRLYRITDMARNTAEYEYNSSGELYSIRNGTPVSYVEYDPNDVPAGIPIRRATIGYAPRSADAMDSLQGYYVREIRENNLDPVYYEPIPNKPGQVRRTSRGLKPFIYGSNLQKKVERFTDPLGNTSLIGYENSLPASLTTPSGDQTRITYNPSGFPATVTDPLGNISRYEYKGATGLVTRYIPAGLTSDQSWRIEYDTHHNPVRATSPLGRVTEMTYGTKGQLLSLRDPAGNVTTSTYDNYGNLTGMHRPGDPAPTLLTWDDTGLRCTGVTDPLGNTKDFLYDANDRLTRVTWSSIAGSPHIDLEWDAFHQHRLVDELGNATTFEHNLFGLRTATTSPLGQVRRMIYDPDNRLITSHDPLSRATTRTYDDAGRLLSIQHPIGQSQRTYDKEGREISYRTPRGGTTSFTYDKNGNRTQAAASGLGAVNFTYTVQNQIATITNARGQAVSHAYNAEGQLTARTISGLGQDTFVYDSRGNLQAATSAHGHASIRTHDARNRVTQIQWPRPGGGEFTAAFVHDAADRLTRLTYPDGTVAVFTYDNRNRAPLPAAMRNAALREALPPESPAIPLSVVWSKGAGTWTATATVDSAGNRLDLNRPNGAKTQWTYDAARRITSVTHRRAEEPFLVQSLTYNADDTTASATLSPAGTVVFPSSITADYTAHDRLVSFGGDVPEYDADGNLTGAPGGAFTATYDALNRLSGLTRDGRALTFTYDAHDRLAGWSDGADTRTLHRDERGRVLFESDAAGAVVALHIRHGEELMARGLPESGWTYYHFDRNGNALALTDAAAVTTAAYRYQPFGMKRTSGAPGDNYLTYGGGHGVIDHGGGIFHMGRRTYDAGIQRFLQKDPIGFEGGDNLYAYAGNNPVDFVDPEGTLFFSVIIAVAAKVVATTVALVIAHGLLSSKAERLDEAASLGEQHDGGDTIDKLSRNEIKPSYRLHQSERGKALVEAGYTALDVTKDSVVKAAAIGLGGGGAISKGLGFAGKKMINTFKDDGEDTPPEE